MWKMIKEGFAYGFGGSLGWSLGEWVAKWIRRLIVACLSFALVMCAGYGQHVSQKMAKQQSGGKHESHTNKK